MCLRLLGPGWRAWPVHCRTRLAVSDDLLVICPYCGEEVEIRLEADIEGSLVQDCEVCCNPWLLRVSGRDEDRRVEVARADGSE